MNNEKKTCKLTLISHYFGRECAIRMAAKIVDKLFRYEEPIVFINSDIDRFREGLKMEYLTESQARKISSWNKDRDYFDRAVLA